MNSEKIITKSYATLLLMDFQIYTHKKNVKTKICFWCSSTSLKIPIINIVNDATKLEEFKDSLLSEMALQQTA
jgi:hypothetical protein